MAALPFLSGVVRVNQLQVSEILQLLAGVAGTWIGAELLVRGSARLALSLGLRPLLVGLTVVALGTSSPEAVVSFIAAARGSGGIAVGNVVGSNIANIGLILGVVSLIHPMRVDWLEVRRDVLLMLLATAVAGLAIVLSQSGPLAGFLLLLILTVSVVLAARQPAGQPREELARDGSVEETPVASRNALGLAVLQSLAGLALLIYSAQLMVAAAEVIARAFGIEEAVIGATVVAVGTSIPEFAASLVAVGRGHYAIGIGNIIGSNLMNLGFVFGSICLFAPYQPIPPNIAHKLVPAMGLFTLVLVPALATSGQVSRREGLVLLVGYLLFSWWVYLGSDQLASG